MSKMNDMAMTIEELRNAAAIADAADWLAQQFEGNTEKQPDKEVTAKPEPKPQLSLEQVRAVLADKSCSGQTAAIRKFSSCSSPSKITSYFAIARCSFLRNIFIF